VCLTLCDQHEGKCLTMSPSRVCASMHRNWGNTDGVGEISPRFSTAKALSQIDNANGSDNIRRKATDRNFLRHTEEG